MLMEIPGLISETTIDRYYFNDDVATFFKNEDEKDLADRILFLYENRQILEKKVEQANKFIEANRWDVRQKEYFDLLNTLMP
jgi:glycosyltransferase involved in cell wall biosynthesis